VGYAEALYASDKTMKHILTKHWQAAVDIAKSLGLNENSDILELGCGDGKFADEILAVYFRHIDAFDISQSAIKRAQSLSRTNKVNYFAEDITTLEFKKNAYWDGAFLIWILHHVKVFTPAIVSRLAQVCPILIVAEPNGNNIIRKLLELLPSYKRAGERSFKLKELIGIFESAGYAVTTIRRVAFVPNYLPDVLLTPFMKLEAVIECTPILNWLCATNMIGFSRRSQQ
jgi:2-polyprenyl-3-methyl-5-hydroxy-6-metoxy-1,4-benzoquinol methylase